MDRSGSTTASEECANENGTFSSYYDPSPAKTKPTKQSLSTVSNCPLNNRKDDLENREVIATDQVDKNLIADLLVLFVLLVVVVGGFALLHTPSILLGGGLALVIAVAAEFVWSR
jgi:hypothetical protein